MDNNRFISNHNLPGGPMSGAVAIDFAGAIPRHFGQRRNAAKHLARMSGATERAAKNWLAGRCVPQAEHMIRLMAECHELEAEVIGLIAALRRART